MYLGRHGFVAHESLIQFFFQKSTCFIRLNAYFASLWCVSCVLTYSIRKMFISKCLFWGGSKWPFKRKKSFILARWAFFLQKARPCLWLISVVTGLVAWAAKCERKAEAQIHCIKNRQKNQSAAFRISESNAFTLTREIITKVIELISGPIKFGSWKLNCWVSDCMIFVFFSPGQWTANTAHSVTPETIFTLHSLVWIVHPSTIRHHISLLSHFEFFILLLNADL